jgi:integrase
MRITARAFLSGGFKSGELFKLKARDISFDNDGWAWAKVGKGDDTRLVPVPAELGRELRDLIALNRMPSALKFYRALNEAREVARLGRTRLTATRLRQSALKEAGKYNPTHVLREFAGHKDYRTTHRYITPVTAEDIKRLARSINEETTTNQ